MSQETKFKVKVYESPKPKRIPKVVSDELKGGASPKAISRMKKESVDCPVVKSEVGFLACFACPDNAPQAVTQVTAGRAGSGVAIHEDK